MSSKRIKTDCGKTFKSEAAEGNEKPPGKETTNAIIENLERLALFAGKVALGNGRERYNQEICAGMLKFGKQS